ncbi:MAG: MBL fold metallo-hydrolase [Bacteroidales bacterium]
MKLTFLGTGTSQGVPIIGCTCDVCQSTDIRDQRLRTSAFIETEGLGFLLDAGPDLRQQLLANKITKVDAILVTHEHKDHIGGIDDIRPINFMMHKTMNIYGLGRVLNIIKKDYDYAFKTYKYPGVPQLNLIPVNDTPFFIENTEVTPIHVQHLTLPILGYRIHHFAYITDASFISEKEKSKLHNLDILVINALRKEEHYSHFNLSQALSLIKELNPKQAYLTHIAHSMGKWEEVSRKLPEHVFLGIDGLSITF